MLKTTREKELSLLCCVIRKNEIIEEPLFQSFDRIFEIANAFIDKYGVNKTEWSPELDYEETVYKFATEYYNNILNPKQENMREVETENYGVVTLRSAMLEDEQGNPFDGLEIKGNQIGLVEVRDWYNIDDLESEEIEKLIDENE